MLPKDLQPLLPIEWTPMDLHNERFKIIPLSPYSEEYHTIELMIRGDYYSSIINIYRLQNPYLFAKYTMKSMEYGRRGPFRRLCLYHDTPESNVASIAALNLDWRFGERFKYGPGVYFSVSPTLANKHSLRTGMPFRAMFVTEVLVQNIQEIDRDILLPDFGYDTVLAHRRETIVKYFDYEYYPHYFVDYISRR